MNDEKEGIYKTHSGTRIKDTEVGDNAEVVITGRPYREVLASLAIDGKKRLDGKTFLTLGDGLSDFAGRFEEETGATVVSSDPIYRYIKPTDSPEEARKKINDAGLNNVAVTISPKKMVSADDLAHLRALKRKGGDIVADVEKLPFENEQLDGILSAHALRYIDLTKSLPEMLRVVKQSGELRFGHPGFEVRKVGGDVIIFPDKKHTDEYRNNLVQFMQKSKDLECYALLEQEGGKAGATVHSFVIKRNSDIPTFEIDSTSEKKKYIRKVAKINISEILEEEPGKIAWKAEIID